MPDLGFTQVTPGGQLLSRDLNELAGAANKASNLTVAPPLEIVRSPAGLHIRLRQGERVWGQITGPAYINGSTPTSLYPWTQVQPTDLSQVTTFYTPSNSLRGSIPPDQWFPAEEINGDTAVLPNSYHQMWLSETGDHFLFNNSNAAQQCCPGNLGGGPPLPGPTPPPAPPPSPPPSPPPDPGGTGGVGIGGPNPPGGYICPPGYYWGTNPGPWGGWGCQPIQGAHNYNPNGPPARPTSSSGGGGFKPITSLPLGMGYILGGGVFTDNPSAVSAAAPPASSGVTTLFDNFADAGNTGSTETDLYSNTIAGSQLATNGDSIEWQVALNYSSSLNNKQARAYFNGTLIFDSGSSSLSNTESLLTVKIIRESSTVVRCMVTETGGVLTNQAYTRITGLDLTTTKVLKVTGQGTANNDLVANFGNVRYFTA